MRNTSFFCFPATSLPLFLGFFGNRRPLLFELAKLFLAALQLPLQVFLHCQQPPLLIHAGLVLQLQLPQPGLEFFDLLVAEGQLPTAGPMWDSWALPGGVTASEISLLELTGK